MRSIARISFRTDNIGIGADIESISRFKRIDVRDDRFFLEKIFTGKELKYCFSYKDAASHLAARYAGKEAIVKALAGIGRGKVAYNRIEILKDKNGMPLAGVDGIGRGVRIRLSLSHCEDKAIAFAVAIKSRRDG